jgi:hypothetical protein
MRRETVNNIRYVLEEWLQPIVRNSHFMRMLFRLHWGTFIEDLERRFAIPVPASHECVVIARDLLYAEEIMALSGEVGSGSMR